MLIGAAFCALSTALCAVATSLGWLVALRFVMGFSGAAGIVVGRAVISDVASGRVAARLFGILTALGGIAPIVAPLAGGAVVIAAGWRGVFWALAAASLLMFLAALFAVPESLPREKRYGSGMRSTLRAVGSVLTNRPYLGYTFAFTFGCGALYCYIAASPFLLQKVLGLSVGQASVAFAGGALTATVSSAVNAKLVDHFAPARLLRIGLATMVAATAAMLVITLAGQLGRVSALGLLGVTFIGLGMVFGNATALAIDYVPYAAGTGSAVLGTLQSALGAIVAPLMGLGGEHTAVPLFLGMTACSGIAALALLLTRGAEPSAVREHKVAETIGL
ncbi:MFS transporter [Carbonactinospora thermoautotrophica]|uniref:MFS transporter n=1 Tax=Carbonactinospora thermoautotrophica TaxID=1469144 RepID=UPI002FCCF183